MDKRQIVDNLAQEMDKLAQEMDILAEKTLWHRICTL